MNIIYLYDKYLKTNLVDSFRECKVILTRKLCMTVKIELLIIKY